MRTQDHADIGSYELTVPISLARADVWKRLIEDTNKWWLPSFHMLGEDSVVTLEPKAGGMLLESHDTAGTLLWYTVQCVEPGTTLYMHGHSFAEWGGPRSSFLTLELADTDDGCSLTVHDSLIGRVTDKNMNTLREGWTQLFGDGLKKFCESK